MAEADDLPPFQTGLDLGFVPQFLKLVPEYVGTEHGVRSPASARSRPSRTCCPGARSPDHALQQDVSYFIPRVNRQPIRTILRATTAQLDHQELYEILQDMVNEAEAMPFSRREIEVSSTRPARVAQELLTWEDVQEPPIDVERIARRCGAQVVKRHFDDDLSGLLIALDEGAVIGVNDTQHEHRQRFTIGHELGHYLLNHHDRFHIDLGPNAEHGDPPGYDWQSERAANQFAANLLMPSTLVHEAYAEDDSTAQLAHRFKVSELAIGYRLIELGLR